MTFLDSPDTSSRQLENAHVSALLGLGLHSVEFGSTTLYAELLVLTITRGLTSLIAETTLRNCFHFLADDAEGDCLALLCSVPSRLEQVALHSMPARQTVLDEHHDC